MNSLFINSIDIILKSTHKNDFNEFIDFLYHIKYKDNYIPTRNCKDKGCDGILNGNTIIACYGPPKSNTLSGFKKKFNNDLEKYKENWQDKHPNWKFIYNEEPTADMIKYMNEQWPSINNYFLSRKMIIEMIKELTWVEKRKIGKFLHIDKHLFENDIFQEIVEDLIGYKTNQSSIQYNSPIYIEDKIRLNFTDPQDRNIIKDEYDEFLQQNLFGSLHNVIQAYDDEQIQTLKSRIRSDYINYSGVFKIRFNLMLKLYASKYEGDDTYKLYVRVVLIYFFEQCLIGIKTEEEINATAPS